MLTVEKQTRTYLYDLMNEAKEHGFKQDDQWSLSMATDAERSKIQRDYFPAVASKVSPEAMLEIFQSVKSELQQPLNAEEMQVDTKTILKKDFKFIVAFNPKRTRF
jgi:hypothetical protein